MMSLVHGQSGYCLLIKLAEV